MSDFYSPELLSPGVPAADDLIVYRDVSVVNESAGGLKSATLSSVRDGVGAPFTWLLDVGDQTTALTAATGKKFFRAPYAVTVTEVRASVSTAPTGAAILVDINDSGTTILSTKLMIDATEKTSTTATTPYVISDPNIADDAEISIDIDQIGSGTAGAGLKVIIYGTRA